MSTAQKSAMPPTLKQLEYAHLLARTRGCPPPTLRTRADAKSFIDLLRETPPLASEKQVELVEAINVTCSGIPCFAVLGTDYLRMDRAALFIDAWGHFHTPSPKVDREVDHLRSFSELEPPTQFGRVTQRSATKFRDLWMKFCDAGQFSLEAAYRIPFGLLQPGVKADVMVRLQAIQEILYDETIDIVEGADLHATLAANDRLIDAELSEPYRCVLDSSSSKIGRGIMELRDLAIDCSWSDVGIVVDGFVLDIERKRFWKEDPRKWKGYSSLRMFAPSSEAG